MKYPSPKEKCILRKMGFNPKQFLRVRKNWESITFIEVQTGKLLVVRRF